MIGAAPSSGLPTSSSLVGSAGAGPCRRVPVGCGGGLPHLLRVAGRARLRSTVLARAFSPRHRPRSSFGTALSQVRADPASMTSSLTCSAAEVRLAFAVGKVRANRKPVLLAMGSEGAVLAFVKLGVNALTDRWWPTRQPSCPAWRSGGWAWSTCRSSGTSLTGVDIRCSCSPRCRSTSLGATIRSPCCSRPWSTSPDRGGRPDRRCSTAPWWSDHLVHPRLPASGNARRLRAIVESLATNADRRIPVGSWHGDWNRGNAAVLADRVLVWDWERFASGVPLGWDALHRSSGRSFPVERTPDGKAALRGLLERAPSSLAPFSVEPDASHRSSRRCT